MIILNQDLELVNFDNLAKISMFSGEIEDTTVYAIVAFESISDDDKDDVMNPDALMLGFYNNESAPAQAFKEGWFCTGDLGRFGKDGSLFITGRKKDLIVLSNGKKVFPEEIEALINKIDIVEESMVYEDNDKICAEIVYSKDNMEKNNLATVDDVRSVIEEEIKIINKNLPIYKYIREFSLTDVPLIKTTTQKIKRHEEMKKIKGE